MYIKIEMCSNKGFCNKSEYLNFSRGILNRKCTKYCM